MTARTRSSSSGRQVHGALTTHYLARTAPADFRWALAGRDLKKLEQLRAALASENAAHADLPILLADVTDPDTLRRVAAEARVVLTTVGPYIRYGEPLVAACAEAGTSHATSCRIEPVS